MPAARPGGHRAALPGGQRGGRCGNHVHYTFVTLAFPCCSTPWVVTSFATVFVQVVPDVAAEPIDADGGASGKDGSNGNNGSNNGMTAGGAASSSKGVQPPAGSSVPSSGAGAGMDTASAAVAMANGWARL